MTIVIILGGILTGVFTATESASMAVLWAFFVTMFIYRDYKWSDLPKLMFRVVKTVSVVMMLMALSAAFGYAITLMQIPNRMTETILELTREPVMILMLINIMLLVLGTVMDMAPMILILTPILLPVVKMVGIDPVHFGMIMITNLAIGLISPPVGTVLFVGSAVGKLPMGVVIRAMNPFWVLLVIALLIITYVPAVSLWLPRSMGL